MSHPQEYTAPDGLAKAGNVALVVGGLAAVASIAGALSSREQFFRSYLTGYVWMIAFPLGSLGLLLLQHLSGGAWGVMIRRILEAASRTLLLALVAFLPIAAGIHHLYEWSHTDVVAKDPILSHKAIWLNQNAFLFRTALYFAVWFVFAYSLNRWSRRQDETGDRALSERMRRSSAVGLVLHIVCVTFAAFDWMMSLTPHWFSTIYGLYVLIGQAVTAMAFVCLLALILDAGGSHAAPRTPGEVGHGSAGGSSAAPRAPGEIRNSPSGGIGIPFQGRHLHDYGKLLFAFTCVWAYFAFSQFIIIWSGNLPEETTWYVPRMHGAWKAASIVLVVAHYILPFALLLSRDRKRSAKRLAPVAAFLLAVRWLDNHWLVAPAFDTQRFTLSWLDLAIPVALGGIWFWFFTVQLRQRSLLPVNEPFLKEALAHE